MTVDRFFSPLSSTPVAVFGAGSFGTALALQLARRGTPVRLWGRDAAAMAEMQQSRCNARYLPGCGFPDNLLATADMTLALAGAEDVLIATPSHALHATLEALRPNLQARQGVIVACKGFEPGTGRLAHEVVASVLGDAHPYAVLSGPTFAAEIGRGLPTAVIIASSDAAFAQRMAERFNGDGFRAYTGQDVIGVEIGGAAKNVIAIAAGASDGLGFGANARSLLITRGLAEISRLGAALGARSETLMGLSGLGDLVLTCTDDKSRNRRMGLLLASGKSITESIDEIQQVVEGIKAAPELVRLSARYGIEMPISTVVCAVLEQKMTVREAFATLASRSVRPEHNSQV